MVDFFLEPVQQDEKQYRNTTGCRNKFGIGYKKNSESGHDSDNP